MKKKRARKSQIWSNEEVEKFKNDDDDESDASEKESSEEEEEKEESYSNTSISRAAQTYMAYQSMLALPSKPNSQSSRKRKSIENPEVTREIKEVLALRKGKTTREIGSGGWMPYKRLRALNRAVNSKAISLLSKMRSEDPDVIELIQNDLVAITGVYPNPEVSSILVENLEYLAEKDPRLIMGFLKPLSQINFQVFLRNKLIMLSQTLLQYSASFEDLKCLTSILFRYGSYGRQ